MTVKFANSGTRFASFLRQGLSITEFRIWDIALGASPKIDSVEFLATLSTSYYCSTLRSIWLSWQPVRVTFVPGWKWPQTGVWQLHQESRKKKSWAPIGSAVVSDGWLIAQSRTFDVCEGALFRSNLRACYPNLFSASSLADAPPPDEEPTPIDQSNVGVWGGTHRNLQGGKLAYSVRSTAEWNGLLSLKTAGSCQCQPFNCTY